MNQLLTLSGGIISRDIASSVRSSIRENTMPGWRRKGWRKDKRRGEDY